MTNNKIIEDNKENSNTNNTIDTTEVTISNSNTQDNPVNSPSNNKEEIKTLSDKIVLNIYIKILDSFNQSNANEKEIMLQKIFDLIALIETEGSIFNTKSYLEEETSTLLSKKLLPKFLRVILHENFQNKSALKQQAISLLEKFISYYIEAMNSIDSSNNINDLTYYLDIWEKLIDCFHEERLFFKASSDSKDASELFLDSLAKKYNPFTSWRKSLEPGNMIDCLYWDNSHYYRIGVGHWTYATILDINLEKLEAHISYKGKRESKYISLHSSEIMPYNTMVNDYDWRENLKEGDEIDALDIRSWKPAIVLEVIENIQGKGIIFAFPEFRNNRMIKNSDRPTNIHDSIIRKRNYYSKKIENEQIVIRYPLDLKKFNELESFIPFKIPVLVVAEKIIHTNNTTNLTDSSNNKEQQEQQSDKQKEQIDDSKQLNTENQDDENKEEKQDNQQLYKIVDNQTYAPEYNPLQFLLNINKDNNQNNYTNNNYDNIHLQEAQINKYQYIIPKKCEDRKTDLILTDLITTFIAKNGHLSLLKALQTLPISEIESFILLINTYNNINLYFHIKFAIPYNKEFVNQAIQWLIKFSLSTSSRNFNRNKIESVLKILKDSLFKSYYESDVNAIMEKFYIDFGINCLNSDVLDMKLLGMKIITDTVSESYKALSVNGFCEKHLPVETLLSSFRNQGVIKSLFKSDTHYQIIQSASELVKYLFCTKIGDVELFKHLYLLTKTIKDSEAKKTLISGLKNNCANMESDLKCCVIEELIIFSTQYETTPSDLELITTIFNRLPGTLSEKMAHQCCKFFFNVLVNSYKMKYNSNENEEFSFGLSKDFNIKFEYAKYLNNNDNKDIKGNQNFCDKIIPVNDNVINEISSYLINMIASYDLKNYRNIYVEEICSLIQKNYSLCIENKENKEVRVNHDLLSLFGLLKRVLEKLFTRYDKEVKDDTTFILYISLQASDIKSNKNKDTFLPSLLIDFTKLYFTLANETKINILKQVESQHASDTNTEIPSNNTTNKLKTIIDITTQQLTNLTKRSHFKFTEEIIQILHFFFSTFPQIFSEEKLNYLFETLVLKSISPKDSQAFFLLLNQSETTNTSTIINKDFYKKVFQLLSQSELSSLVEVNKEFTKNIWKNFLLLNKDRILYYENKPEQYSGINSAGVEYYSYSFNPDKEPEIKVNLLPENLDGFSLIWKIVILTGHLSKNIVKDLLLLFLQNEFNVKKKAEVWESLIILCIGTIKQLSNNWNYMNKNIENNKDKDRKDSVNNSENDNNNSNTKSNIFSKINLFLSDTELKENKITGIQICLSLLSRLIEESEINGTADVISQSSMIAQPTITLKINNLTRISHLKAMFKKNNPDKNDCFSIQIQLNKNLWDLKKLIAAQCKLIPEALKIYLGRNKDISEKDHGKTLSKLKFKDNDEITIMKNPLLEKIPKAPLTVNKELNPLFVKALKEIFSLVLEISREDEENNNDNNDTNDNNYNKNVDKRVFDAKACSEFVRLASESNDVVEISDIRVCSILNNFGNGKELKEEEFIQFYHHSIFVNKKINIVWENLACFNYRNDLKKIDEPLNEYNNDKTLMPRYIISENEEYFNVIFNIQSLSCNENSSTTDNASKMKLETLSQQAYKFLNSLSTNKTILNNVYLMQDNFDTIITLDNPYLGYILGIIESFFIELHNYEKKIINDNYNSKINNEMFGVDSNTNANGNNNTVTRINTDLFLRNISEQHDSQIKLKYEWMCNFIYNKGLKQIISIIVKFKEILNIHSKNSNISNNSSENNNSYLNSFFIKHIVTCLNIVKYSIVYIYKNNNTNDLVLFSYINCFLGLSDKSGVSNAAGFDSNDKKIKKDFEDELERNSECKESIKQYYEYYNNNNTTNSFTDRDFINKSIITDFPSTLNDLIIDYIAIINAYNKSNSNSSSNNSLKLFNLLIDFKNISNVSYSILSLSFLYTQYDLNKNDNNKDKYCQYDSSYFKDNSRFLKLTFNLTGFNNRLVNYNVFNDIKILSVVFIKQHILEFTFDILLNIQDKILNFDNNISNDNEYNEVNENEEYNINNNSENEIEVVPLIDDILENAVGEYSLRKNNKNSKNTNNYANNNKDNNASTNNTNIHVFIMYEFLTNILGNYFIENKDSINSIINDIKDKFYISLKKTEEKVEETLQQLTTIEEPDTNTTDSNNNINNNNSNSVNNQAKEILIESYLKLIKTNYSSSIKEIQSDTNIEKNKRILKMLVNNLLIKNTQQFSQFLKQPINKVKHVDIYNNEFNIEGVTIDDSDVIENIYSIITLLIKNNDELFNFFLNNTRILEVTQHLSLFIKDKYDYNPNSTNTSKYLGLKNPSCICYINSVLQQIYHIPTLRNSLLQVCDNKEEEYSKSNNNNESYYTGYDLSKIDDNTLHQLQRTFSYLLLSKRESYLPIEFTYSFKDWDGLPTNLRLQQDSQEFLSRLLDKLEFSLSKTKNKYLIKNIFSGKVCSQIRCKGGCGSIRNNFEDLYYLSIDIKNINSLSSSLNNFITEETIEDYECEYCKKKVNLSKRASLSSLPNVLFIHLKRFNFNYETFLNEKINTKLEFPNSINLKDYCTETICNDFDNNSKSEEFKNNVFEKKNEYYEFKLVGVIVHMGNADGGHYYSFINDKRNGIEDKIIENCDSKNWVQFNDNTVSFFNAGKLEEECFGGSSGNASGWYSDGSCSNKNAYMLVYERISKTPLQVVIDEEERRKLEGMLNI